jgi:anthranilate 1,2-dioxygenase small subunit
MNVAASTRILVEDLITESAMLVDSLVLDRWLDCFQPDSRYMVIPKENRDRGLPAAIINCQTRAILEDRITVLHKASKFNPHVDRHILGRTRFLDEKDGVVKTETNFMIVQSTMEGFSKLFCAGVYEDSIQVTDGNAKFKERVAVVDTFSVPNLIATPI